jgi:8-oxo-dGTP pyrophosphatase MutT (NUDIX family)
MVSDAYSKTQHDTPVQPRDAASLVIVRDGARGPEILMGRRPLGARFMPGVYVFPGGAVDAGDYAFDAGCALPRDVLARLTRKASEDLARALAWTALRETWEETGLLLGAAGTTKNSGDCPALQAYAGAGLKPNLAALDYLIRAVTPPYIPIRFNTRFFIADGRAATGPLRQGTELEDIAWRSIDESLRLKVVNVTEIVLEHARRYWTAKPGPDPARATTMFTQSTPGAIVLREE